MASRKFKFRSLAIDAPGRRRLPILLRHAWFSLNQAFRRRIAHTGVTPDQFTTLRTLEELGTPQPTQSQLTRLLASDPNTIASLLERMAAAGWIARTRHEEDRRAYRISLLPEGRKKYLEVRQIAVELQTELLAAWPERRREEFLENLQSLADRCRGIGERPERSQGNDCHPPSQGYGGTRGKPANSPNRGRGGKIMAGQNHTAKAAG